MIQPCKLCDGVLHHNPGCRIAELEAELAGVRGMLSFVSLAGLTLIVNPLLPPGAFYCHPDTLKTIKLPLSVPSALGFPRRAAEGKD